MSYAAEMTTPVLAGVRCRTCGGSEMYLLARAVDGERIELHLCRSCDAHHGLVRAIDRLTAEALAE